MFFAASILLRLSASILSLIALSSADIFDVSNMPPDFFVLTLFVVIFTLDNIPFMAETSSAILFIVSEEAPPFNALSTILRILSENSLTTSLLKGIPPLNLSFLYKNASLSSSFPLKASLIERFLLLKMASLLLAVVSVLSIPHSSRYLPVFLSFFLFFLYDTLTNSASVFSNPYICAALTIFATSDLSIPVKSPRSILAALSPSLYVTKNGLISLPLSVRNLAAPIISLLYFTALPDAISPSDKLKSETNLYCFLS